MDGTISKPSPPSQPLIALADRLAGHQAAHRPRRAQRHHLNIARLDETAACPQWAAVPNSSARRSPPKASISPSIPRRASALWVSLYDEQDQETDRFELDGHDDNIHHGLIAGHRRRARNTACAPTARTIPTQGYFFDPAQAAGRSLCQAARPGLRALAAPAAAARGGGGYGAAGAQGDRRRRQRQAGSCRAARRRS